MSSISSSFANTLGAILIGFAISCCVYGMLIMQIFVYIRRYPSDRPVYKLLVRSYLVVFAALLTFSCA